MSRLALIALLLLAGCTTAYRVVAVPPHLIPPRAEMPRITAAELECLEDDTYIKLGERERALRFEIDQWRDLLGRSP
jgi:hypothetical protein